MNIAFSAVILFVLLLPPIGFYIAFTHSRFQKKAPDLSLPELLMITALFAMLSHAMGIALIRQNIQMDLLLYLITGNAEQAVSKFSNMDIERLFLQFTLYCFIQLTIASVIGKSFRRLIQKLDIHSKIESLRIYNQWWYLFNGYYSFSHSIPKKQQYFDLVHADVLVNTNAGAMLYSGFVSDYICQGEILDRIYLTCIKKSDLKTITISDKGLIPLNKPGPRHVIKGKILCIPASEILNINLNFIDFSAKLCI